MKFKALIIQVLFQLSCIMTVSAQDSSLVFYKVIEEDSVVLFFNGEYKFTEESCADFFRRTRIDIDGNFNGNFEDFNSDSVLQGKGRYDHGLKNGLFELYHPNNQLKAKGRFSKGIPVGDWYYFYENGVREKIVRLSETDTTIVEFSDTNGVKMVEKGEGDFEGFINAKSGLSPQVFAKGKVQNGKPSGNWTSTHNGELYCNEKFVDGKFYEGNFPNSKKEKNYKAKSFLNNFFTKMYFSDLELYNSIKCNDSFLLNKKMIYMASDKFLSEIKLKVKDIILREYKIGTLSSTTDFELSYSVKFASDKNGISNNYVVLTKTPGQYFNVIPALIEKHMKFPADQKELFFHSVFRFNFDGTCMMKYQFSNNSNFNRITTI